MRNTIRRQILRLERQQAQAINRADLRGAVSMFDKNFVGFSSTQDKRIRGLRALVRTFRYYLKRAPKLSYRIELLQVHEIGSTAVATFYWTVGLGQKIKIRGRGTHVFLHQGKDWRVIHEHFSRAH